MNLNKKIWEKEYQEKKLMRGDKPQRFFLKFLKFVKKEYKKNNQKIERVLDLGSGEGKNSIYLAERGFKVSGIEFAENAVRTARQITEKFNLDINFIEKSFGEKFDFSDNYFDIILDINSSNSLNKAERKKYLTESFRVLKLGGYFLIRIPAKDGDQNAKKLLKQFPGPEEDTYTIPEFGLTEKVFSKDDLLNFYKKFFKVIELKKETRYSTYGKQKYKRNFWILILQKI